MTLQVGILLAFLCAFATNVGFLLKHRGACAAPDVSLTHPVRSAVGLFRSKWFTAGMLVATGAWGFHVGALALAPLTQRIAYLDEGDWVVARRDSVEIFDRANQPVEREIVQSGASAERMDKGNHAHFMRKEIFEQPIVVAQTLQSYVRPFEGEVALPDAGLDLAAVDPAAQPHRHQGRRQGLSASGDPLLPNPR